MIDVRPAIDLVVAAENRLTTKQKKIEQHYGKVARARPSSITHLVKDPQRQRKNA